MSSVAVHHESVGPDDGPALLLGGSLGTTCAMWEPQLPALSAGHRVVAFDHRGHGRSPAPAGPYAIADLGADVLALMDAQGIDQAAYVGLSIGGMVGQWLAIHAPQRVTALILICTTAAMDSPDPWRERAAAVRAAGTPEVIADTVVSRWFTGDYRMSYPDTVARHRAMIATTGAEGYAGCCEAIAGLDLRAGLAHIRAPTLVMAGAQDEAIPASHSRRIAQSIPGARYELLDPAAHLASVERADAVIELIADHLRGDP
jgi:3-oxoadipate enol-lactonase